MMQYYPYDIEPPLPFNTKGLMGKHYINEFMKIFKELCTIYVKHCLTTKRYDAWDSRNNKPNPKIWSFTREPSFDGCLAYITRENVSKSIVLWRDYIISSEKCVKYINDTVEAIILVQRRHIDELDADMNRIITTLVDELASKNPPKKPKNLAKFIDTIPYARERAYDYKDTHGLGRMEVTYGPFADNTVRGSRTIKEWYNQYLERFELARLSLQEERDKTYRPKPSKIPKDKKNVDNRPVHDKDTLAYPFKSKLKQYRKTVDADVPYIEPPEQPRIPYELLYRPYFSHEPGCWEIDHAFNVLEEGDKWMFCINVNTRYLVVYPIPETIYDVWIKLQDLHAKYKIKSLRGDGSTKYCSLEYQNRVVTPEMIRRDYESGKLRKDDGIDLLMRWYMRSGITIYFNSSPFTLHNKIVDVVIKTMRNAIGYRRLKPKHMAQLVDYYNNTIHKSIGCTPAFMQEHPEVEYQYIRWCERKLTDIISNQKLLGYLDYKPGNVLMVHIDKGKTSEKHEKRRRFFDKLGVFVRYDHGNVVVDMLVKGVRVRSGGEDKIQLTVPVYHTKFVSKNIQSIPAEYKDYYINSMKAIEIDDIYNKDDKDDKNNDSDSSGHSETA